MKKIMILALMIVLSTVFAHNVKADQSVYYQVSVYDTDGEGLALKAAPDINSARYLVISENERLYIDQISGGWGHTVYNGYSGWVALRYTRITGGSSTQAPVSGYIYPVYYYVSGTGGEGLELRSAPTMESSTFGPLSDGSVILARAIQGDWAYTLTGGNFGWVNLTYLTKWSTPSTYQATVYGTGYEGLALKADADVNSSRYAMIPENTALTIDNIKNGWGHTYYNGYNGWVSLRYTMIPGRYPSQVPVNSFVNPKYYIVNHTDGEGLELRTAPSIESSTFGPLYDGTVAQVQAIEGEWAYLYSNGRYGWCNMTYLFENSRSK